MTPRAKARKPILAWGGFVDGRLDRGFRLGERDDLTPLAAVFTTRKAARLLYADVRRVEVREVRR